MVVYVFSVEEGGLLQIIRKSNEAANFQLNFCSQQGLSLIENSSFSAQILGREGLYFRAAVSCSQSVQFRLDSFRTILMIS